MKEEFYVQVRYRRIDPWENRWSKWIISPDSYEKTIENLREKSYKEPEMQIAKFYYYDEEMTQYAGGYSGVIVSHGKVWQTEDK